MNASFFTTQHLAEYWNISSATLRQWRWSGRGPCYLKLGGRILYRMEDIQAFEDQRRHTSTSHVNDVPENAKLNPQI